MTPSPEVPSPSEAELRAWLVKAVAAALDVVGTTLDTGRPFQEYGVTSAQAVSLSGELEEWLGRDLSPALLYEHPTIDSLSAALAGTPGGGGQLAGSDPVPVRGLAGRTADGPDCAVAVVGLSCRFPGEAEDPGRFWGNLLAGRHAGRQVPPDRWSLDGFHSTDRSVGGTSYTDRAGFVSDLAGFDAGFFGIAPGEARRMDPQHRLLLEVVWAALEDAGIAPDAIRGSRTGVFVGLMGSQEWGTLQTEREGGSCLDDPFFGYGLAPSVAAGRVSYVLDARGPSLSVDTACSSSLLAVHLAARSLREGECDLAVVAGVSALVHPAAMVQACRAHMLAADGRCKTFDAEADGFLIGEGCGAVVLQRVADAGSDRQRVRAYLRGSAVGQDGRSNGMTAPSRSAQVAVISAAHADAGVDPTEVAFVEAHGSGTRLGDAIEMTALQDVFGSGRDPERPLVVGAVKTNVGHLLGAAGMAGFIKTVLALEHGVIPPNLHLSRPSPDVDWTRANVLLPSEVTAWPLTGPRVAGVSSFGWSGTNVHVVLQQPDEPPAVQTARRGWQLLPLSAASAPALRQTADRLCDYLTTHPDASVPDVAHVLRVGRAELPHRVSIVAEDRADLLAALREASQTVAGDAGELDGVAEPSGRGTRAVFMFPGTGDQHLGMGAELYRTLPAFRAAFDRCADAAAPVIGLDLRRLVTDTRATSSGPIGLARQLGRSAAGPLADHGLLERVDVTHAAVFAVEFALAANLLAWGARPDLLLGYSLGEYTAAAIAGVFEAEVAVRLVARRAQLIAALPPGAMVAVPLPVRALEPLPDGIEISASCGTAMTVVGGTESDIGAYEDSLRRDGVVSQRVASRHAMHTSLLRPAADTLAELVRAVSRNAPRIPIVSTVTGKVLTDEQVRDPGYWAGQMCRTVRFDAALATATADPDRILLELGPGQALSSVATQIGMLAGTARVRALPTMRSASARPPGRVEGSGELAGVLQAAGRFWAEGGHLDWHALSVDAQPGRVVRLPTYPFQHQRFWPDSTPLPGNNRPDPSDWCYQPTWRRSRGPLGRAAATGQHWWVVGRGGSLAHAVGGELAALGAEVTEVTEAISSDGTLPGRTESPPTHVLLAADGLTGGAEAAADAFLDVMELVQALGRGLSGREVCLAVLTSGAYDVIGDEELHLVAGALGGLRRIVTQEYPSLRARTVDATGTDRATARLVAAELAGGGGDDLVAYRAGRRWVHEWAPDPITPAAPAQVWRPDGSYLITGGLGGLGLAVARRLAAWSRDVLSNGRDGSSRLRLALVNRQPLPPRDRWGHPESAAGDVARRIAAVRDLEALGAEVMTVAADVADEAQLHAAVQTIRRQFGALNGVIHAAGAPASGLLALKTRADAERVLRPKVAGALVLERVLDGEPLDFLVHFSSATVAVGGLGESDYAAANCFLDAHAHAARRRGRPVTAVDWGPWRWDAWTRDGTAGVGDMHVMRERFGISDEEGFDLLTRILAAEVPQVLVAQQDLDSLSARWAELGRDAVSVAPPDRSHPRPLLRTPYVAARTELERHITRIWGRYLGVDRVGVDDPFFELGGTSLVGLTIVAEMERELGIRLGASDLYEAPTPATLAALVQQRQCGDPEPDETASASRGAGRGDKRREHARRAAAAVADRRSRRDGFEREDAHGGH